MKPSSLFQQKTLQLFLLLFGLIILSPVSSAEEYQLVYSAGSDRNGQTPLSGAVVSGNLYGRMEPETNINRVFYFLDGASSLFKTEYRAPYDLNGGPSSAARAYDTTRLSDGVHTIRGEILLTSGEIINVETQFTVANQAPPVNTAPVLTAIGNQSLIAGSNQTLNLSANDADNDNLSFSLSGQPSYIQLTDNGNGTAQLIMNPTAANVGTVNITISVSDGQLSDSQSVQIQVTAAPVENSAPILSAISNQSLIAGSNQTLNLSASDANNDNLSFSLSGQPSFIQLTDNGNGTAQLSLNPTAANVGTVNITVSVTDGQLSDSQSVQIQVTAAPVENSAPILSAISNQSLIAGSNQTLNLSASDANNDNLSFSLSGQPSYIQLTDNGNGTAQLIMNPTAVNVGTINITVSVSDGQLSDSQSVQIQVTAAPVENSAPILSAISNQSLTAGSNQTLNLSASDANNDNLSFSLSGQPSYIQLTDNGNGTAQLIMNPTAANVGTVNITISVTDGQLSDSQSVQIQVTAVSNHPYQLVYSAGSDRNGQTPLSGAVVSGNLYGRMEPETNINRVFYFLDGASSLFKTEYRAPYDLNGGPSSAARAYDTTRLSDGVHTIRGEILLTSGEIINVETQFTVANQAPPVNTAPVLTAIGNQSLIAGSNQTLNLSASDIDNDSLSFSLSGQPSYIQLTDNGNGTAQLSLNPTATNVGTINITVSVTDGQLSDSQSVQIQVTAAPVENSAPVLSAISNQSLIAGSNQTLNLSASDANNDNLSFSLSGQPGYIQLTDNGNGTAQLSLNPTAANVGTINITVSVSDGQLSDSQSVQIQVTAAPVENSAPILSAISNQSLIAGSNQTLNLSASDANNDNLSFSLSGQPSYIQLTDNGNGTAQLSLNPTATNVGTINITVSVTDGQLSDSQSVQIQVTAAPVENSAPVLSAISNQSLIAGSNQTLNLSASDANNDNLSFSLSGQPGYIQLTDNGNGTAQLSLNPTAANVGTINITVSVSDGQLSDSQSVQIQVTAAPVENSAPILSAISNQSLIAGSNQTLNLSASDANNDNLSFSLSGQPSYIQLTDNGNGTAQLSLNPTAANVGTINITVSVTDGQLSDSQSVQIQVIAVSNHPYQLVYSVGSDRNGQTPLSGAVVSGNLYGRMEPETNISRVFYFLDGASSLFKTEYRAPYDLNGGPSSAARAYDTTRLSDGVHTIRGEILLTSGEIINVETQFTVANQAPPVNTAPVLTAIGNQSLIAGSNQTLNLSASDANNDNLSFSLSGQPSYIQLTDNGNGTAQLIMNPTAANVGTVTITISVSDGELSDSEQLNIIVSQPSQQSLIISEFVASNKSDYLDGEDWIEIHNQGTEAADPSGWCLTDTVDDLSLWCFPEGTATIAAGGYLIVVADKVDQPLHANLKLSAGGEYLALVKPDGAIATEFASQFPAQKADISYGFNAAGLPRYFTQPTPAAANGTGVIDLLDFAPDALSFAVSSGSASSQTILTTLSATSVNATLTVAQASSNWLSAQVSASDASTINIVINASGLDVGSYSGIVTASASNYGDAELEVRLTVTSGGVISENIEISEFMASNGSDYAAGEDWIELHNMGTSAVNLSGWCLTDTADDLSLWCFPEGSPTLTVDGYLVVIADKGDQPLHAGLKLSSGGEYLALIKPDGTIAAEFSPEYPEQTSDVSYGINPNGELRFFTIPTPGAANNEGVSKLGSSISVSHGRGFYNAPIEVSLQQDADVDSIRYTRDGSEPTESLGQLYNGTPISISSTTILRIAVIKNGAVAEKVSSHSYLFLDDVIQQSSMDDSVVSEYSDEMVTALQSVPTMSIAANPNEISGSNGFYGGDDIEKAVSVEVLYADDESKNHQANSGIESHSHNRAKRSLRLNFRAIYGDAKFKSDLISNAPLNGDTAHGEYDKLILRGGNNRCWCRGFNPDKTTYTIDQFYRDSQIVATGSGMRGTYVHLYINGEYYGLYNAVERADKHFLSDYFSGEKDDWFSINHGIVHDGSEPLNGDRTRYDYLTTTLVTKDMSDPANYAELQEYLQIDEFIDYLLVSWWTGVGDWPDNNWYAGSRNPSSSEGQTGLRFFAWDGEWSWDAPADFSNDGHRAKIHPEFRSNKNIYSKGTPGPDSAFMIAQLWHAARQSPAFMLRVEARVSALLDEGGALSDSLSRQRWTSLTDFVYSAVIGESARWGDQVSNPARTRDLDWQNEVDAIYQLIGGNAEELKRQLREEGYIP